MGSNQKQHLIGLVAESPKWGYGVVWRTDKYDRLSMKLMNGTERTGLREDAVRFLSEEEVFENKGVMGLLKQSGLLGWVKRPYGLQESTEKKKSEPTIQEMLLAVTQGTSSQPDSHPIGPWVCQDCFMTFDPAQHATDKVRDGHPAVKVQMSPENRPICPYCGSFNTRYIAEMGPVVNSELENVPGIGKLMGIIDEGDISVLKGRKINGISDLISLGVLDEADIFGKTPKIAGTENVLWEEASNTVWRSGKIVNGMAHTINYNNLVNTWANLFKLQEGYYPAIPIIESLKEHFERQNTMFEDFVSYLKCFNEGTQETKHEKLQELKIAIKDEKVVHESLEKLNDIRKKMDEGLGKKAKKAVGELVDTVYREHLAKKPSRKSVKPVSEENTAAWSFDADERTAREFASIVREDFAIQSAIVTEKDGEWIVAVVAEDNSVFDEIEEMINEEKYEVPKYSTKFGKMRTQVEEIIESLENVDLSRHVKRMKENI